MRLPKATGGDFEKCPAGNHLAVCYCVVDLGTQETNYGVKHQIWIGWETASELMTDGRPFTVGKTYTLSSHEKSNLRNDLESWRGRPFSEDDFGEFEIGNVIGVGCFLNVVHTERENGTYANIASIAALPKGTTTPALVNKAVKLDLDPDTYDVRMFAALSEYTQQRVAKSPEYREVTQSSVDISGTSDDEIPF